MLFLRLEKRTLLNIVSCRFPPLTIPIHLPAVVAVCSFEPRALVDVLAAASL